MLLQIVGRFDRLLEVLINEIEQQFKMRLGLFTVKRLASLFELVSVVEENSVRCINSDVLGLEGNARELADGIFENVLQMLRVDLEWISALLFA